MTLYELTYLISPDISKEEIKSLQDRIKSSIQKDNGSLGRITSPIKKRLAFKIKNKKEAFLDCLSFSLDPEKIKNLREDLKKEKQILRYLLFKKKLTKKKIRFQPRRKVKPRTKVELKEIEKKLDEILDE